MEKFDSSEPAVREAELCDNPDHDGYGFGDGEDIAGHVAAHRLTTRNEE